MGVVMPLAVPLAWAVVSVDGLPGAEGMAIFYSTIASVLMGLTVMGMAAEPIAG